MAYWNPWSHTFEQDELQVEFVPLGYNAPKFCDIHPACFKALGLIPPTAGEWGLVSPLNIPNEMPGTDQKLTTAWVKGMRIGGGWGTSSRSKLWIYLDGAEIVSARKLKHGKDWETTTFDLNRDVSTSTEIDLKLRQYAEIFWPGAQVILHDKSITLEGEYYTVTPPPTANVRLSVTNKKTGDPVSGAEVALMKDAQVLFSSKTDGGEVLFEGVTEGGYVVRVLASGYYSFERAIQVTAPEIWEELRITPRPKKPIPWWVWPAVGGVVLIGAVTIIPRLMGKKEKPVYVVK